MPERRVGPNALLAIVILCYLVTGAAYAWLTPIWETPDEPAHYNYVRHLVYHKSLPVLEADNYDFAYLEQIKAAQFPPDMSIDSIRYEPSRRSITFSAQCWLPLCRKYGGRWCSACCRWFWVGCCWSSPIS